MSHLVLLPPPSIDLTVVIVSVLGMTISSNLYITTLLYNHDVVNLTTTFYTLSGGSLQQISLSLSLSLSLSSKFQPPAVTELCTDK